MDILIRRLEVASHEYLPGRLECRIGRGRLQGTIYLLMSVIYAMRLIYSPRTRDTGFLTVSTLLEMLTGIWPELYLLCRGWILGSLVFHGKNER